MRKKRFLLILVLTVSVVFSFGVFAAEVEDIPDITIPDEITKYITETLHRSATIWNAHGAFTDADKFTIYTAMTPYQAAKLKDFAKSVDEHAFVTINKTSEIYGKGFLPFGKK